MKHQSVLIEEVISGLNIEPGDTIVDATLGAGGHSLNICKLLGKKGVLIAIDADSAAIKRAEDRIGETECNVHFVENNFRNIDKIVKDLDLDSIDGVLFDLGMSSDQLESSGRGFSFGKDEPLLMTLSDRPDGVQFTADEIVNEWSREQIADIIHGYGEERFARRIASVIVENRKNSPIKTSKELADVISDAVPSWYKRRRIHPATKTFQALRIAVNDEIEALKESLTASIRLLNPGGRIVVISFHSIEDRVVKHFFKESTYEGQGTILTKKPITPSAVEVKQNPRARSAKLRIFEKNETKTQNNKKYST